MKAAVSVQATHLPEQARQLAALALVAPQMLFCPVTRICNSRKCWEALERLLNDSRRL